MEYADRGELGTGVFLRLLEGGGTHVSFKPKLTYRECRTYGLECQAFKWIPEAIAVYVEVHSDTCLSRGEECLDKGCAAKGCICNNATNTCADASGNAPGSPPGGTELDPEKEFHDRDEKKRKERKEEEDDRLKKKGKERERVPAGARS
jgi:hypothetical protein